MTNQIIFIADLVDPDDPEGRTYREVNAAKGHAIPVGSLVELKDGVRLWVVALSRDCDQTPLYTLAIMRHGLGHTMPGYPEDSLRVVPR